MSLTSKGIIHTVVYRKQDTSVACSTTQIYYYSHSPIGKRPTRTVFYFLYMHVTQLYDMHILMCNCLCQDRIPRNIKHSLS